MAEIAQESYGNRLTDALPYLEAEVVYAATEEMATSAVDVMARRMRMAFLDAEASAHCANRVVDIMAETLHWDDARKKKEMDDLRFFLHTMTVGREDEFHDDIEVGSAEGTTGNKQPSS